MHGNSLTWTVRVLGRPTDHGQTTDRQTYRQTDRQTYIQTDRQRASGKLSRPCLTVQAACLQQGTEEGGSPLVVGGFIGPKVGLVGGPVDGVQLAAEGAF